MTFVLMVFVIVSGASQPLMTTPTGPEVCFQRAESLNTRELDKRLPKRVFFCAPVVPA